MCLQRKRVVIYKTCPNYFTLPSSSPPAIVPTTAAEEKKKKKRKNTRMNATQYLGVSNEPHGLFSWEDHNALKGKRARRDRGTYQAWGK